MLQSKAFVKKTKKGKVLKVRRRRMPETGAARSWHGSTGRDSGNGADEYAWSERPHRCMLHATAAASRRRRCLPPTARRPAALSRWPPQVVREHYLRDDIYSGSPLDPECPPESCKLSGEASHYLLVDTNVVLHQVCGVGWVR